MEHPNYLKSYKIVGLYSRPKSTFYLLKTKEKFPPFYNSLLSCILSNIRTYYLFLLSLGNGPHLCGSLSSWCVGLL